MPEEAKLYPLSGFAAVLLRERGIDRTYDTLHRWATTGWRNGKRLECHLVSGVMHTSLKAFDDLMARDLVPG